MARQTFNDINITPLTDIFLVLLIIMMVIAPMLDQQGLSLTVPEFVEAKAELQDPKILNITVTADDIYLIDETPVDSKDLEKIIKEKTKTMTDGVMIQSESNATHGAVVHLMDVARNSGVTNISITEI